jgi:hypothetical protein
MIGQMVRVTMNTTLMQMSNKKYDTQREVELLRKLFVLTAKRSMRPSMTDNMGMRLIFEELHLLTNKDEYKL